MNKLCTEEEMQFAYRVGSIKMYAEQFAYHMASTALKPDVVAECALKFATALFDRLEKFDG